MSTPSTPGTPGTPPRTTGTDPLSPTTGPTAESSSEGDAKGQAKEAAGTAKDQGSHVAGVAKGEAQNVAGTAQEQTQNVVEESKVQARGLLDDARTQLDDQSRTQRDRLVGTLRTFGDDLEKMANGEQTGGGMAQDLARKAAERARDLSSRLDGREPAELLDEVRNYARRRPGTFLLGALAAGVVAGRLTRGAKDARQGSTGQGTRSSYGEGSGTASGAPTAGTGYPDVPPAYPEGSAVDQPGTTAEQNLSTPPGTTGAPTPAAESPWADEPRRGGNV